MGKKRINPAEQSAESSYLKSEREPANEVLNKFLQENDIFLGLSPIPLAHDEGGHIMLGKPQIIAMYKSDIKKKKGLAN